MDFEDFLKARETKKEQFISKSKNRIDFIINEATKCFIPYNITSHHTYNPGIGFSHNISYYALLYDNIASELNYVMDLEDDKASGRQPKMKRVEQVSTLVKNYANELLARNPNVRSISTLKPYFEELRLSAINMGIISSSQSESFIEEIITEYIVPEARKIASKRFKKNDGMLSKVFGSIFGKKS